MYMCRLKFKWKLVQLFNIIVYSRTGDIMLWEWWSLNKQEFCKSGKRFFVVVFFKRDYITLLIKLVYYLTLVLFIS